MAAFGASVLLIAVLVSFCGGTFAAGGWTEARPADTDQYRGVARFAYREEKPGNGEGLTFLVTQARYKMVAGIIYNVAFIVLEGDRPLEKCITIVRVPPIYTGGTMRSVTKFWCRPVRHLL
ncbi:hypothetical protein MTO96_029101 [Rhipicephalus appendiculatus]